MPYPCIKVLDMALGLGALCVEVDGESGGAALFLIIGVLLVLCLAVTPLFAGLGHARKCLG